MIYPSTPEKERPMIELDAPIISRLPQDLNVWRRIKTCGAGLNPLPQD
jgi:hypothetical protein